MIIGLCGPKRVGKDTVAQILREEYGFSSIAFADPLKDAVARIFVLDRAALDDDRKDQPIAHFDDITTPRHILQFVGTDMFRSEQFASRFPAIGDNIWIRAVDQYFDSARTNVVVTDVRFPNEAQCVRDHDGQIWQITRDLMNDAPADLHASEQQFAQICADVVIDNNGTIDQLRSEIQTAFLSYIYTYSDTF
jgi:dephospho-CoA kinase